jgi:hypothetical protein
MAETDDPGPWYKKEIWLILIILLFAGVTLWNSRATLFPDKFVQMIEYSNFGFTFRHPQDADLWEVGLDAENVFDYTGTIRPSEDEGMVGYDWEGLEVAVTWLAVEQAPTPEEILETHYTSVIVNGERRDREITITKGELETRETNEHSTVLQFHSVEIMMPGSSEPLYGEGYVDGWYCLNTGKFYTVYVYQWNSGQPPDQTEAQALARLNTFLKTLRCHS